MDIIQNPRKVNKVCDERNIVNVYYKIVRLWNVFMSLLLLTLFNIYFKKKMRIIIWFFVCFRLE